MSKNKKRVRKDAQCSETYARKTSIEKKNRETKFSSQVSGTRDFCEPD